MNWKRILAVVIVCVLSSVLPDYSQASGGSASGISPRYSYTRRIEAGLQISRSGNAYCEGAVAVYDENSTISIKVSLYQKISGSWERLTSWYENVTGEDELVIERYYQLPEYGLYKVLVTGTVTAASGDSEWISLESDQMTYP